MIKEFYNSQSIPGTAIGMHASEANSKSPMQMSLDSFKSAGESRAAGSSVSAVEEILYAKKVREHEVCTIHYKNKYMTYEQVLNSRQNIVECIVDDFLLKTRYNTINNTYSYHIDAYKHLPKKWWHNEFYIETILKQRVPDENEAVLRLHFDLINLYKYKMTLKDIVDELNDIYEGLLNIIYGPMEDGIIDIQACITYNKKSKNVKKRFDIIITDCDNEEMIEDDMIISAYYNNQLLPAIKKIKMKGISGIKNLTPIVIPVLSVIVNEKKAWMISGSVNDEILTVFELLDIKTIKKTDTHLFVELPTYDLVDIDMNKNTFNNLTFIQYIDARLQYDKKTNPNVKQTKLIKIFTKIKKLNIKPVFLTLVNKNKLYKLGIQIDRLSKLYELVNINTLTTYNDEEYETLVVEHDDPLAPREFTLKLVRQAKEDYNFNGVYSDILNQSELVTAEVEGRNLKGLLTLDFLDTHRTTSNNMHVIASVFGIEAAQKFFIEDLNRILSNYGLHPQHILTVAYLFFSKGIPTGAMHNSVNKPYGPIDKASVSKAVDILKSSALQGVTHNITGVSTGIVFGLAPKIGTGYFNIGYQYDENTILYNKDIYKSFKMDRDKIDEKAKEIVPIDTFNADDDMNDALNYYGRNELPKIIKSKQIANKKYVQQEVQPTIKSTKEAKQQTAMTVKSKYDI
jgi:hypothetical protein